MNRIAIAILAGFIAAVPAGPARAAGKHAAAPMARSAEPASIPYDELKDHVGQRIVVHSTFGSTRIGVLAKFTAFELTLSIPTSTGPAELTMPKDTVLRVTAAPAEKR